MPIHKGESTRSRDSAALPYGRTPLSLIRAWTNLAGAAFGGACRTLASGPTYRRGLQDAVARGDARVGAKAASLNQRTFLFPFPFPDEGRTASVVMTVVLI